MNGLPYYKRYPRGFIEGTIGLSFELKAAYGLVLDLIYMQGGNLPDDSTYISGMLGCNKHKWASLRKQLLKTGKIEFLDGFFVNSRAFLELKATEKFQRKQSEIASKPRKNKDLQQPQANHTDTDTDTDIKNTKKECVFESDFEKFWDEYPHRKGSQNKQAARKKYLVLRKRGVVQTDLVQGAKNFFAHCSETEKVSTEFVPMASTWLNQERWEDEY